MEIKSYLKEKQEVVYKTLKNSFKNNKTSHAYLVVLKDFQSYKWQFLWLKA